jgi:DNA-directed RNA polymerase subunit RPC12/RpoP
VSGEVALLRKLFPTFVTHVLLKRYNRNIRYVWVKSSILFYSCFEILSSLLFVWCIYIEWKTYPCGVCGKEFKRADHRKRHEESHNYTITCPVCGQYFNRRENMLRHRALRQRPEVMKRPPSPGPSNSPPKQPLKAVVCCRKIRRTISGKVDTVISCKVKLYLSWTRLAVTTC